MREEGNRLSVTTALDGVIINLTVCMGLLYYLVPVANVEVVSSPVRSITKWRCPDQQLPWLPLCCSAYVWWQKARHTPPLDLDLDANQISDHTLRIYLGYTFEFSRKTKLFFITIFVTFVVVPLCLILVEFFNGIPLSRGVPAAFSDIIATGSTVLGLAIGLLFLQSRHVLVVNSVDVVAKSRESEEENYLACFKTGLASPVKLYHLPE